MRACLRAHAAELSEACKAAAKGPRTEGDTSASTSPMRKADAKN